MSRVSCRECGGSGKRWGFNREIECFDCNGVGTWDEEPTCACCEGPLDANGYCIACDDSGLVEAGQLTGVHGDPLLKRRAA